MGAPGPFSNASPDITEWLPLLGSIVQALCGGGKDQPPVEDAQAAQNAGETASQPTHR